MDKKIVKTILGLWLAVAAAEVRAQQSDGAWQEPLTVNEMRAQRGLTEMGSVFVPK